MYDNSEVVFSKHALYQLAERNLSENEVISTLLKPDKVISQSNQKFQAIKLIKKNSKKIFNGGTISQNKFN